MMNVNEVIIGKHRIVINNNGSVTIYEDGVEIQEYAKPILRDITDKMYINNKWSTGTEFVTQDYPKMIIKKINERIEATQDLFLDYLKKNAPESYRSSNWVNLEKIKNARKVFLETMHYDFIIVPHDINNHINKIEKLLKESRDKEPFKGFDDKAGNGIPHAIINTHFINMLKKFNSYKEYLFALFINKKFKENDKDFFRLKNINNRLGIVSVLRQEGKFFIANNNISPYNYTIEEFLDNYERLIELGKPLDKENSNSDFCGALRRYKRFLEEELKHDFNDKDIELNNFFCMLKFMIEQSENNIKDEGKKVSSPSEQIGRDKITEALDKYKDPLFKTQYIEYNDFNLVLNFHKQNHWDTPKVVWVRHEEIHSINIRFYYKERKLQVHLASAAYADDNKQVIEILIEKYNEGLYVEYIDLGLDNATYNDKVVEIYDYFNKIITDYYNELGKIKVKELDNEKEVYDMQEVGLNTILYGPPGTGKTYILDKYIDYIISNNKQKESIYDKYIGLTIKQALLLLIKENDSISIGDILKSEEFKNSQLINGRGESNPGAIYKELKCNLFIEDTNNLPLTYGLSELGKEEYNYISNLINDNEKIDDKDIYSVFTTFHQSYSYESFIEGLKATTDNNGDIKYEVEAGIFKKFCLKAQNDIENKYVFVIDEINRGNISSIFGELLTLIEPSKRLKEKDEITVMLPYSNEKFGIPSNVYIIGTMNTADRSIAHIDTALRRRFDFIEMMPKYDKLNQLHIKDKDNKNIKDKDNKNIKLGDVLENINKRIEYLYDREHTIGHAFFLPEIEDEQNILSLEQVKKVFINKIIPLLQEYFYDDYEKITLVLNDKNEYFISKQPSYKELFKAFNGFEYDDDKIIYRINNHNSKAIEDKDKDEDFIKFLGIITSKNYDNKDNLEDKINDES